MVVLVFGSQGSGKTTHALYIAGKLGLPYISMGDILRVMQEEPTERGRKVKELMSQGFMIPDEWTVEAFGNYLKDNNIGNDFVLEGFPRSMEQFKMFPYKVDKLFEFTLSEDTAIERLKARGRYDDVKESIERRLNFFKEKTLPVIDHYKKSGIPVFVISNEPSIEEVQKEIDEQLKN